MREAEAMGKFKLENLGTASLRPVPSSAKDFVNARREYQAKVPLCSVTLVPLWATGFFFPPHASPTAMVHPLPSRALLLPMIPCAAERDSQGLQGRVGCTTRARSHRRTVRAADAVHSRAACCCCRPCGCVCCRSLLPIPFVLYRPVVAVLHASASRWRRRSELRRAR